MSFLLPGQIFPLARQREIWVQCSSIDERSLSQHHLVVTNASKEVLEELRGVVLDRGNGLSNHVRAMIHSRNYLTIICDLFNLKCQLVLHN